MVLILKLDYKGVKFIDFLNMDCEYLVYFI